MSEYMRAMKLQKDKYTDDALSLFMQLLQTQLLYEVICNVCFVFALELAAFFSWFTVCSNFCPYSGHQ